MKTFKDTVTGLVHQYEDNDDIKALQDKGVIPKTLEPYEIPEPTQAEIITQMIADGERLIEAHIQKPIDEYNLANGVNFAHAHTCANYKDEVGYAHQAFCQQAWSFNVAVWEAGRLIQTDVLAGTIPAPTSEEFITMLPVFGV